MGLRCTVGSSLTISGYAAAVVLMAVAWYSRTENQRARRQVEGLLATRQYPYLVSGLHVDILGQSRQLDGQPAALRGGEISITKLVLLLSDSCGVAEKNLPNWEILINKLAWSHLTELWLVTFATPGRFASLLRPVKQRQARWRLLKVTDPSIFVSTTGLAATPTTAILDGDSDLRAIWSGPLTSDAMNVLISHWNSLTPTAADRTSLTERR